MNISEAARTGRKFRRTSDPNTWYRLQGKQIIRSAPDGGFYPEGAYIFDAEMIIATDWEQNP